MDVLQHVIILIICIIKAFLLNPNISQGWVLTSDEDDDAIVQPAIWLFDGYDWIQIKTNKNAFSDFLRYSWFVEKYRSWF